MKFHTAYNGKIRHLGSVVRAPLTLSPRWNRKMSRYRFQSISARTVSIFITTYISNRISVFQKILTFLNHHSPTSTSPAGLIFLLYSLFFSGLTAFISGIWYFFYFFIFLFSSPWSNAYTWVDFIFLKAYDWLTFKDSR